MNLQQLEYIVAVDMHRHFVKAAEHCFVTQSTLSMMIKKLEDELGVLLFDRSKQPVIPTEAGTQIISQARVALREVAVIQQIAQEIQGAVKGELRIGVIPTLAPYLLPLFLSDFMKQYPLIKLKITEQTTAHILKELAMDSLDVGIMATPLQMEGYMETPLFYERFKVYVSNTEKRLTKNYLLPEDIDVNRLWLLEEGHCLRTQALNLCELKKQQAHAHSLEYEAGSMESLLKIVEINEGLTIVPELVTLGFDEKTRQQLRDFKPPVPLREVSLVTYRHFVKKKLLEELKRVITCAVEKHLPKIDSEGLVVGM